MKCLVLNCKQHKPPFYVSENLTPTRNKILYFLRKAKRLYPIRIASCKSFDGKVYVFVQKDGSSTQRIMCNTLDRLDKVLIDELGTTESALTGKL